MFSLTQRTQKLTDSQNESPEFEIDPTQNPPTRNGYYTILFRPISANVSGIGEAGKNVTGDDTNPGKVVLINDGDADNDGIPDYADGYNLRPEIEADEAVPGAAFVPIHFSFYAIDPDNAKIKFTYSASDPMTVTATSTNPYQLPANGKMRLWMKNADGGWTYNPATYDYDFAQRDGRPVSQGGDFIEPGVEYSLEDLGLDPDYYYYYDYGAGFTVYAEVVKTSDAVADLPVKIEIKPNANLGYVFSDQVRFTGVATEVLSRAPGDDTFTPASMLAPSRFRVLSEIENPSGIALPQIALLKLRITDPRSNVGTAVLAGQEISLSNTGGANWETPEFLLKLPGTNPPSAYSSYPSLRFAGPSSLIEYNPSKHFSNVKFEELPKQMQQTYSDMQRVAKQMHDAGWQPPASTAGDTGIFGKELHRNMSQEYANKRGRIPDVWLDADGKVIAFDRGYEWAPPPAQRLGSTQIDLLIVKGGYRPVEGRLLDRSRLISVVDFKSSGRVKWGDINADFATRVKTHTGLNLWAPISEYRYNFSASLMEANKNVRRTTKLLRGLNIALPLATLMALPYVAGAMDNAVDKTQAYVIAANGGGDDFSAQLEMALSLREVLSLLSISPVQEIGNYYATIALAVLDVAPLFAHDPEYD